MKSILDLMRAPGVDPWTKTRAGYLYARLSGEGFLGLVL